MTNIFIVFHTFQSNPTQKNKAVHETIQNSDLATILMRLHQPFHNDSSRLCKEHNKYPLTNASHAFAHWSPRPKPRNIIALSLYDCEHDLLQLKLVLMHPHIDYFLLAESKYANSNRPRTPCFNWSIIPPQFKHQVKYHFIDTGVNNFQYWEAEVYNRNQLSVMLSDQHIQLSHDDYIIVTDLDELISRDHLYYLKHFDPPPTNPTHAFRITMRWSYYGFEWLNPNLWTINAIVTWEHLQTQCRMQTNAVRYNLCDIHPNAIQTLPTMGWHCSWCFPTQQFIHKIQRSAHVELNTDRNTDINYLKQQRQHGLWFPDSQPNACYDPQAIPPL